MQFYGNLTAYIQGKNSNYKIVLNPGTVYKSALTNNKGANVISIVYEKSADRWSPSEGCAAIQRDNLQGSCGVFPKGPWCDFIPTWDDIEQLKNKMDTGSVLPAQSAAIIYSVPNDANAVNQIIQDGWNQKIGWFYLTEQYANWSALPGSIIWNAMISMLSQL